MDMNKLEYDAKYGGVKYDWELYFPPNKLGSLSSKHVAIKLKDDSGRFNVGEGVLSYLSAKYKEEQPIKKYNFSKFTPGVANYDETEKVSKSKFDPKHVIFEKENEETNPIQTDTTDATFEFDNENAIVVNFISPSIAVFITILINRIAIITIPTNKTSPNNRFNFGCLSAKVFLLFNITLPLLL